MYFHDRKEAGQQLATALSAYKDKPDAIVLALPRGGVPVAYEVAVALHLPLDLMLVRKLGVPNREELAMGAIASGNVQILNYDIIHGLNISDAEIADVIEKEHAELERRNQVYRHGKPAPILEARTVILVDDGCATGANMRAAVEAVVKQHAARIIVAIPITSDTAYEALKQVADEVICLDIPEPFFGVGRFYHDFAQTKDAEVKTLLQKAQQRKLHKNLQPT